MCAELASIDANSVLCLGIGPNQLSMLSVSRGRALTTPSISRKYLLVMEKHTLGTRSNRPVLAWTDPRWWKSCIWDVAIWEVQAGRRRHSDLLNGNTWSTKHLPTFLHTYVEGQNQGRHAVILRLALFLGTFCCTRTHLILVLPVFKNNLSLLTHWVMNIRCFREEHFPNQ